MGACGWYGAASGHGNLTVEFGHCSGSFLWLGVGVASPPVASVSAVRRGTIPLAITGAGTLRGVDGRGPCVGPHAVACAVNLDGFPRVHLAAVDEHGERTRRRIRMDHAGRDHGSAVATGAIRNPRPRGKGIGGNRSGGNRSGGEQRTDASDDRTERHGNLQRFRFNPPTTTGGGASCIRTASGAGSPLCQDSQRLCKCESGGGMALSTCGYGMSRSETVTGQYFQ